MMSVKIDARARTNGAGYSVEFYQECSTSPIRDYMSSKFVVTVPSNSKREKVDFLDYIIDSDSYERKYTGDESFIASYLVNRLNYPVDTIVRVGKDKVSTEKVSMSSYIKCDGKMYYKELGGYGVREVVIKNDNK